MKKLIPACILRSYQHQEYSGEFTAATMFIDISGFTAMTQNLMKNGKEGAEVLTAIINNIFTPAIDAIYDSKGFISTFAGDAFTAIFPSEVIPPFAAVIAADRIQQIFRQIGLQKSKFGDFQLYVKIGLSHGQVEWGLIRNKIQNAYYFRGNAINSCAYSEHQCTTGDTVLDVKLKSALQSDIKMIHFQSINDDYSLINKVATSEAKTHIEDEDYLAADLPEFVPQVILDRKLKGEFRDIISAFLSFNETDNLKEGISDIISIAAEYGGYFNKADFGDKGAVALVLFGAPIGREKLNERACDFALKVQKMAADRKIPLRLGLTMGKVFAGFVGSERRSEYTALGMTVNLSARFMMKADWQEIFIDRRIFANIETLYDSDFLGEMEFKGFSEKMPVYRLLHKKEQYEAETFSGELVGRQAELQQLRQLLHPIEAGRFGGIVYIDGIAGIGKSRLISEMQDQLPADKFQFCFLPCDEILRKSFNPFVYFLQNYFRQSDDNSQQANRQNFEIGFAALKDSCPDAILQDELNRGRSFLGALLNLFWEDSLFEQLDAQSRYENTLYAVKSLFKALCLIKPVIIVLDDGHWIDRDSEKILAMLTHNVNDFPFIVISACRFNDDETQFQFNIRETPQTRLELNYLDEALTRSLTLAKFESVFGVKNPYLPPELHSFIWEKSSGNPFFIEQLVLYFFKHKILDEQFRLTRKNIEIPSNINAIIVARIDRLTEEVKEVIKTASVIGKEFVVKILSLMLKSLSIDFQSDKLKNVIDTGKTENIWNSIQEIKYIFKHALIRESVYEIQLKERLRELHKLAAETIESIYQEDLRAYSEELAFHYERAEETEKAIHWLGIAADKAKYNFQNEKALDLNDRRLMQITSFLKTDWENISSVLLLPENEKYLFEFIDTLFQKKYFLYIAGRISDAEQTINLAEALADKWQNNQLIAKVMLDKFNILQHKGRLQEAKENLLKAEPIFSENNDFEMLGLTYRNLGIVSLLLGKIEPAFMYFNGELAAFRKTGNQKRYADALGNIGVMYRHLGQYDKALEYLDKQLALAETEKQKIQIARALGNKGWVYEGKGDFPKAIEFYQKALVMNRELGMKGEIVRILDNTGFACQHLKEYEKAEQLHRNALEIAREIDDKESIVNILANLGHACLGKNELKQASQYYDDGMILAEKYGFRFSLAEILIKKAEMLCLQNRLEDAKIFNEKGLKLAKEINYAKYITLAEEIDKKISK